MKKGDILIARGKAKNRWKIQKIRGKTFTLVREKDKEKTVIGEKTLKLYTKGVIDVRAKSI